jgi:hypothetical protein
MPEADVADEKVVQKREKSTIDFPYLDLDDAIGIVTGIHEVGGSSCLVEQLAAQLKQAPSGGGFRLRLIVARIFGLVRYDKGEISLTELGNRMCDPTQERGARIDAFLTVPLYRALYDKFRGTVLPPPSGLEGAIANLGVPAKQKDKARQTFMRAARQAGFFDFGPERLVMPTVKEAPTQGTKVTGESLTSPGLESVPAVSQGPIRQFHPFIEGLLQKLPPAENEWSREDRKRWLQTAANIFDLMYVAKADEGDTSIIVHIS